MEFLIVRLILLVQFYGRYVVQEGNNLLIIGFILISLSLYLIYLNWSKLRGILLLEGIISLIVSVGHPVAGIIFSIAIVEYIGGENLKNKGLYVLAYIPLVSTFINKSVNEDMLFLLTLINIIVLFSYITINRKREYKHIIDENLNLKNKLYDCKEALKLEKATKEQQLENLKLEERNKLSVKMHDKIGHILATALMQLRATLIVIDVDLDKGKEMIGSSVSILDSGMEDIRATLKEIKPVYGEIGINKIKELLDHKVKYSAFKYHFIYKGELEKINFEQWTIFIDGVKELTTNILKYSKGNKINVKLEVLKGILQLRVQDNGERYNKFKKGMGLTSIEETVLSKRGNLVINNKEGFEVTITLPIEGAI